MTDGAVDACNRMADKISAIYGEPFHINREPYNWLGEQMVGAAWMVDGRNHGFKIMHNEYGIKVLVWAHGGSIGQVEASCREWTSVEAALSAALPLVFGDAVAAVRYLTAEASGLRLQLDHARGITKAFEDGDLDPDDAIKQISHVLNGGAA